jgi:hypothetical protein
LGTSPIHAARLRPDPNAFQSPISATRAVATIGPIPGISSSRRLASHDRCHHLQHLGGRDLSSLRVVLLCEQFVPLSGELSKLAP